LCAKQLKDSFYAEQALRLGGQLSVAGLIEALKAGERTAREKALRILSSLGEVAAEAVPELTKLLHHKDLEARLAAAKSLWNITKKAEAIVPALIDLLEEARRSGPEADEERRRLLQTIMEALRRIGPAASGAAPALMAIAKDKNRHVSESAVSALREIAPAAAAGKRMR
jgi:HEAT repeat protein